MKKKISVIGMIICAVIVVGGIVVLCVEPGMSRVDHATFGGDFYSDIYKAVRAAANNLQTTAKMLRLFLGCAAIGIGLAGSCYFGVKYSEANREAKQEVYREQVLKKLEELTQAREDNDYEEHSFDDLPEI